MIERGKGVIKRRSQSRGCLIQGQVYLELNTEGLFIKPVFHLANLFARTEKKQLDLAGDQHCRHHQPITFAFCLFVRTNSPSGKPRGGFNRENERGLIEKEASYREEIVKEMVACSSNRKGNSPVYGPCFQRRT